MLFFPFAQPKFSDIGSEPTDFADALGGTPVHMGLNTAPGFKLGHFGLSAIVNHQTNFSLKNEQYGSVISTNAKSPSSNLENCDLLVKSIN